jgi:hypothetical protein
MSHSDDGQPRITRSDGLGDQEEEATSRCGFQDLGTAWSQIGHLRPIVETRNDLGNSLSDRDLTF